MKTEPFAAVGSWMRIHRRLVFLVWGLVALSLGVFAPRLEGSLSGAMWQVDNSQSLAARQLIDQNFGGLSSQSAVLVLHSDTLSDTDPAFAHSISTSQGALAAETAFGPALPPQTSPDGHTVMIQAGALVDPTEAVRAADRLSGDLQPISNSQVTVDLTGAPAFWSDFNAVNRAGMQKAEIFTWPVTAVILVIAFGSLAAAGLPLALAAAGLVSAMGVLFGVTQLTNLSIWTLNFAMMFALALGIDYSLFIVSRFRNVLHRMPDDVPGAVGETMNTAGKAIFFSGLTVIISLSAVLLVPIPAFRSMAAGMMLSVAFVLLAALTLLPAMLGPGVNRFSLPWHSAGEHRSERWERFAGLIQRRAGLAIGGVLIVLLLLASPLIGLKTGMPSISVLSADKGARVGYETLAASFGPGAAGPIQIVVPPGQDASSIANTVASTPNIAAVFPPQTSNGYSLINAVAGTDPSSSDSAHLVGQLRGELPSGVLVGGPVAENYDLDHTLRARAPIVIGVVLALGFVLLLFALQALIMSALGVVLNLLSVGAGFGVGAIVFQHGVGSSLLGFESQGYLTSWAPLFFFALIFAMSMDYTVFLLASTREHFERTGDPDEAVRASIAHTANPIIAAAGVMVAVFLTFALAGTLPMKEMGLILAVSVLADAALVRLILVPAVLHFAGRAAWWLPAWLDRVLPDVRYAH
jgi:putative drug exporter of the RND superfamily